MRKIKFRAKAAVNDKHSNIKVGDWVFGSYLESGCDAPCIIFGDGEQIEVDKNTLGQFIGIEDVNGLDIYEGDNFETSVCLSPDGISSAHNNFHWITVNCKISFDKGRFLGRWELVEHKISGKWTFNKTGMVNLNTNIEIIKEAK